MRWLSLLALLILPALATDTAPRERTFHFSYQATVKDVPAGAGKLSLWIPVPHDDAWQRITNLKIESPSGHAMQTRTAAEGNTMAEVSVPNPASGELTVRMTFDAVRKEHRQAVGANEASLDRYLRPDRLVPLDDKIRGWAEEVVRAVNAKTDLEKARAIYEHVVATVKYDKTGKGWGRGDIYYACDARRGNCTDFHAIVIGYSRAVGLPARFAIGFPLPADRGEGAIAGYHCWAEVYVRGAGWIPIDASEAAKNPSKREYFFGAHDENRIELSKGRDVMLEPRQQGEPLNYFVYPYAEMDGKPWASINTEFRYQDIR